MRVLGIAAVLVLVLAGGGCARRADEPAGVAEVTVEQLAARLARGDARAVDANGAPTRQRFGVIPGALLLSDYETFLPAELGPDKAKGLVFYCANEHCGASHEAAVRAVAAGYRDVAVLPAGIAGWAKAGQQTAKL